MNKTFNSNRCEPHSPDSDTLKLRQLLPQVEGLADFFKILGDETRTKIIYLLSCQPLCVCDLAAILETSLPAISHHLRLLKAARLVKYKRDGKMVFYSLDDHHILNLIQEAQAHYGEERNL